jgi:putative transposase
MPNYRRVYQAGGTYFFTINLKDRSSDLLTRHIHELRESWRACVAFLPFTTIAAVVLPDHMHIVMKLPQTETDFPTRIGQLKLGFTRRLPEALKSCGRKGERGIWQSRYWEHMIRDERDLQALVDYVHFNPVKHGYVAEPSQWPFSTWTKYSRYFHDHNACDDLQGGFGEP